MPGFGLRISASGLRSWIAKYRVNGKVVFETIGTVARIPKVEDARDLAHASMAKAQAGENPVIARKIREEAASRGDLPGRRDAVYRALRQDGFEFVRNVISNNT